MHDRSPRPDMAHKEAKKHPKAMMSVESMLNPIEANASPAPTSSPESPAKSLDRMPPLKKQKLTKDAPVFVEGKPRGPLRYPPHDVFADDVRREIVRFKVHPPTQDISRYPRHIPYSSAKKGFQQKTSREAFEVFHYTFEVPAHDQEYVVMWDYNIGLVRITPFFKCCGYAKTVPGKMLAANPGLKDICHSITGGALAAQGYWMPYEAARALAATFCHGIRYALLPLFGADFASECLGPQHDGFSHMIIDRSIIARCTRQAAVYCAEEAGGLDQGQESSADQSLSYPGLSSSPRPQFTEPSYDPSEESTSQRRHARQRKAHVDHVHIQWPSPASDNDRRRRNALSSTPEKYPYHYLPSPKSDSAMATSGAASDAPTPRSFAVPRLPSPRTLLASKALAATCAAPLNSPTSLTGDEGDQYRYDGQASGGRSPSSGVSPKSKAQGFDAYSENYSLGSGSTVNDGERQAVIGAPAAEAMGKKDTVPATDQTLPEGDLETYKAAWMLLQLHMADSNLKKRQNCERAREAAHSGRQVPRNPGSTAPAAPLPDPATLPVSAPGLTPASVPASREKRRASM